MRTSNTYRLAFVAAFAAHWGCSAQPGTNVVIVREEPAATGGAASTGGAAPITFGKPPDPTAPSPAQTSSSPPPPGGGGAGGAPASGNGGAPSATGLPCDVATYLAAKCVACHGSPPLASALSALVSYADLKATSKEDPTKNEAELSVSRMKNAASPMPPGAVPPASDVAILEGWISAGYPMGSCGGTTMGDGGAVVAPPPPHSVFDGAPAFAARTGSTAHNAGKDCMTCHRTGGGEAPQFSFGGTLYDSSGHAVAGAEVRLVDASGKATSVYTASNGTFYSRSAGFAAPAQVAVRNATAVADMISPLQASNGGCTSCHCTGGSCTVPPIHLP